MSTKAKTQGLPKQRAGSKPFSMRDFPKRKRAYAEVVADMQEAHETVETRRQQIESQMMARHPALTSKEARELFLARTLKSISSNIFCDLEFPDGKAEVVALELRGGLMVSFWEWDAMTPYERDDLLRYASKKHPLIITDEDNREAIESATKKVVGQMIASGWQDTVLEGYFDKEYGEIVIHISNGCQRTTAFYMFRAKEVVPILIRPTPNTPHQAVSMFLIANGSTAVTKEGILRAARRSSPVGRAVFSKDATTAVLSAMIFNDKADKTKRLKELRRQMRNVRVWKDRNDPLPPLKAKDVLTAAAGVQYEHEYLRDVLDPLKNRNIGNLKVSIERLMGDTTQGPNSLWQMAILQLAIAISFFTGTVVTAGGHHLKSRCKMEGIPTGQTAPQLGNILVQKYQSKSHLYRWLRQIICEGPSNWPPPPIITNRHFMMALYLLVRHNGFEAVLQHMPTMASSMVTGGNYKTLVGELGRGHHMDFNVVVDTMVDMSNSKAQVGGGRLAVVRQITQALQPNTVLSFIR